MRRARLSWGEKTAGVGCQCWDAEEEEGGVAGWEILEVLELTQTEGT